MFINRSAWRSNSSSTVHSLYIERLLITFIWEICSILFRSRAFSLTNYELKISDKEIVIKLKIKLRKIFIMVTQNDSNSTYFPFHFFFFCQRTGRFVSVIFYLITYLIKSTFYAYALSVILIKNLFFRQHYINLKQKLSKQNQSYTENIIKTFSKK